MPFSGRRRRPFAKTPPSETAPTVASGKITAITGQARDPERLNVYLDGEFAFGIDREVALREGLRVGDDLDPTRTSALRAQDEIARATNAALIFLGYRARSEREVRDRLHQKGYPPETITAVIERLNGWGYLNDADFARFWTENRAQHKPRGRRLLEQELRFKGVAPEVVRETLDETEFDDEATALALARDRLRRATGADLDPEVQRRRLAGFLARRGYDYDVVRRVMKQVFEDENEVDEEPHG
jgi:regulatory protein